MSGGAGGHAALTEDLEQASGTLERAAAEVDEAAGHLSMAAFWLDGAMHRAVPEVRAALQAADAGVSGALHGTGGVGSVAADLADAAARTAAVARAYEDAEGAARQRIGAGQWWGRALGDLFETATLPARVQYGTLMKLQAAAWGAAARASDGIGDALLRSHPRAGLAWKMGAVGLTVGAHHADRSAEALLPDRLPPTTGYLNGRSVGLALAALDAPRGPLPSIYEANVRSLAAVMGFLEHIGNEPLYVGAVPSIGSAAERPGPSGVTELIEGIGQVRIGEHGAVAIDTVVQPDGTRAHIVRIPGTHDFSLTNASPFDNRTNLVAVNGGDTDTAALVRDALTAAGVLPHEPVMLVGHSQGGIVAATIAADVDHDFNVTHVVAAGSPADRIECREGVQYLLLSSEQEVVHQLDGRGTADQPHVTTVVADLRAASDPAVATAGLGVLPSHAVTSYVAVAQAADASSHASMRAWKASAAAFLGSGSVTTREYVPTFAKRPRGVSRRDRLREGR
ncbi:MAG: hypothetical protein ACK4MD_03050 [Demequina sp.]